MLVVLSFPLKYQTLLTPHTTTVWRLVSRKELKMSKRLQKLSFFETHKSALFTTHNLFYHRQTIYIAIFANRFDLLHEPRPEECVCFSHRLCGFLIFPSFAVQYVIHITALSGSMVIASSRRETCFKASQSCTFHSLSPLLYCQHRKSIIAFARLPSIFLANYYYRNILAHFHLIMHSMSSSTCARQHFFLCFFPDLVELFLCAIRRAVSLFRTWMLSNSSSFRQSQPELFLFLCALLKLGKTIFNFIRWFFLHCSLWNCLSVIFGLSEDLLNSKRHSYGRRWFGEISRKQQILHSTDGGKRESGFKTSKKKRRLLTHIEIESNVKTNFRFHYSHLADQ